MPQLNRLRPAAIIVGMLAIALIVGLAIALLPIKLALLVELFLLAPVVVLIVLLLPAGRTAPYKAALVLFAAALAVKFMWPNYAYVPIAALPSKNPQRWLWAICILFWLYLVLTNQDMRSRLLDRLRQPSLAWTLLALMLWRIAAVFNSQYPAVSMLYMSQEIFDYLPALLFALTWIRDERDVLYLTRALCLTAVLIGTLTAAEVLAQRNLFTTLVPTDVTNEDFLRHSIEAKLRGGAYRAQASFNHPLLMAQFAVFVLPLAVACMGWKLGGRSRFLPTVAVGAILMMLVASRTRTAVVVAAVVLAWVLIYMAAELIRDRQSGLKKPVFGALLMLAGTVATVLVIAVAAWFTAGTNREESGSTQARLVMLKLAQKAAVNEPVLGYGPGVGNQQAALTSSSGISSLDSYYLTQLLEAGIPALLMYSGLVAAVLWRLTVSSFTAAPSPRARLFAAWLMALTAFGISSLILSTPHNMPLFFTAVGVLVCLRHQPQTNSAVRTWADRPLVSL